MNRNVLGDIMENDDDDRDSGKEEEDDDDLVKEASGNEEIQIQNKVPLQQNPPTNSDGEASNKNFKDTETASNQPSLAPDSDLLAFNENATSGSALTQTAVTQTTSNGSALTRTSPSSSSLIHITPIESALTTSIESSGSALSQTSVTQTAPSGSDLAQTATSSSELVHTMPSGNTLNHTAVILTTLSERTLSDTEPKGSVQTQAASSPIALIQTTPSGNASSQIAATQTATTVSRPTLTALGGKEVIQTELTRGIASESASTSLTQTTTSGTAEEIEINLPNPSASNFEFQTSLTQTTPGDSVTSKTAVIQTTLINTSLTQITPSGIPEDIEEIDLEHFYRQITERLRQERQEKEERTMLERHKQEQKKLERSEQEKERLREELDKVLKQMKESLLRETMVTELLQEMRVEVGKHKQEKEQLREERDNVLKKMEESLLRETKVTGTLQEEHVKLEGHKQEKEKLRQERDNLLKQMEESLLRETKVTGTLQEEHVKLEGHKQEKEQLRQERDNLLKQMEESLLRETKVTETLQKERAEIEIHKREELIKNLGMQEKERLQEVNAKLVTTYEYEYFTFPSGLSTTTTMKSDYCNCTRFNNTILTALGEKDEAMYRHIEFEVNSSIKQHSSGMTYSKCNIISIEKVWNCCLWSKYRYNRLDIQKEGCSINQKLLFHGSSAAMDIVSRGFDERHSNSNGMFGAGIYFSEHSSKSNQYVFGHMNGCPYHADVNCTSCHRYMLLCCVVLGKQHQLTRSDKMAHPPPGFHSVMGLVRPYGLRYPEHVIYRGEQAYPAYLIKYTIDI